MIPISFFSYTIFLGRILMGLRPRFLEPESNVHQPIRLNYRYAFLSYCDSNIGDSTFTCYFFNVYSNLITKSFYSFWFFLFRTSNFCRSRTFLCFFSTMLYQTFPTAYIYLTYHLSQLLLKILTPIIVFTGFS